MSKGVYPVYYLCTVPVIQPSSMKTAFTTRVKPSHPAAQYLIKDILEGSNLILVDVSVGQKAVLWIRTYLFRIRIRRFVLLNYGSGLIRILPGHFCVHWKIILPNRYQTIK
jgi:hypothetical protein